MQWPDVVRLFAVGVIASRQAQHGNSVVIWRRWRSRSDMAATGRGDRRRRGRSEQCTRGERASGACYHGHV